MRVLTSTMHKECTYCGLVMPPGDDMYPAKGAGGVQNGRYGHFACAQQHAEQQGEHLQPPICKHWARKGMCLMGETCFYRHPPDCRLMDPAPAKPRLLRGPASARKTNMRNKWRATMFRKWLIGHWGLEFLSTGSGVLDVAGGKGELAFELMNLSGTPATVIDPRPQQLDGFIKRLKAGNHHYKQVQGSANARSFDECMASGPLTPQHLQMPLTMQLVAALAELHKANAAWAAAATSAAEGSKATVRHLTAITEAVCDGDVDGLAARVPGVAAAAGDIPVKAVGKMKQHGNSTSVADCSTDAAQQLDMLALLHQQRQLALEACRQHVAAGLIAAASSQAGSGHDGHEHSMAAADCCIGTADAGSRSGDPLLCTQRHHTALSVQRQQNSLQEQNEQHSVDVIHYQHNQQGGPSRQDQLPVQQQELEHHHHHQQQQRQQHQGEQRKAKARQQAPLGPSGSAACYVTQPQKNGKHQQVRLLAQQQQQLLDEQSSSLWAAAVVLNTPALLQSAQVKQQSEKPTCVTAQLSMLALSTDSPASIGTERNYTAEPASTNSTAAPMLTLPPAAAATALVIDAGQQCGSALHRNKHNVATTAPAQVHKHADLDAIISVLLDCSAVVGLHPDQATEPIAALAVALNKPFAVIPCCVHAVEYPNRRLSDGSLVVQYNQLVEYLNELAAKAGYSHGTEVLPFEGKNVMLYGVPQDLPAHQ